MRHKLIPSTPLKQEVLVLILLTGLCGLLYWWGLGAYPLLDVDEPRYAQTAVEMLQRQDWLIPYFNHTVRLDKPPLIYWLNAWVFQWLEPSASSARFMSALPASLTVFLFYGLGRLAGRWSKTLSALVAAMVGSCLEPVLLGHFGTPDMLLSFWLLATFASFAALLTTKKNIWWLVAGLAAGLGTLTKGPVAIVLPGLVLLAFTLWTGQFKRCFLTWYFPAALGLCALVAVPWYLLAGQAYGPAFWEALYFHNITRFQADVSGHGSPWYFYIPVLLLGLLPWLPVSFLLARSLKSQPWLRPLSTHSLTWSPSQQLLGLSAFWGLGVFLFYSFSTSKLFTYVLPAFAPLVLLLGYAVWEQSTHAWQATAKGWQQVESTYLSLLGALITATVLAAFFPNALSPLLRQLPIELSTWDVMLPWFVVVAGLSVTLYFWRQRHGVEAMLAQTAMMALLVPIIVFLWMPKISKSVAGGLQEILPSMPANAAVIFYKTFKPSVVWERNRFVGNTHNPVDIARAFRHYQAHPELSSCLYILGKQSHLDDLEATLTDDYRVKGQRSFKTSRYGALYQCFRVI